MGDRWFPRYHPFSGGMTATPAGDRSAPEQEVSADAVEERWPPAMRLIFMIGAATLCWAILGVLLYLLW
jgi:hypothetical protein